MQGSKLISLVKSLSTEEFQRFSKFVRSPYFTMSKDVLRLQKYLWKYYPEFDSPKLKKEEIFKRLFPKTKYSDIKLRNLMSKLTRIMEDYLLHLDTINNEKDRKRRLVKIYNQRNLSNLFERETIKLLEELEKSVYRDSIFYYDKFELLYDYYLHPGTLKQGDNGDLLTEAMKNLEFYYALEHLQIIGEIKNRKILFDEKMKPNSERTMIQLREDSLVYDIFLKFDSLYERGDVNVYNQIKEKYLNNFHDIREKDTLVIFFSLLNYVIKQVPYQEINSFKEVFEWYQFGIEKSILITKNRITNTTFLNIVVTGSKLKEFVWVRQFILQYETYLDSTTKEDIKLLGLGFWHFHKGEYDVTVELLLGHNFAQVLHQLNAKALLIRTYYELFSNNSTFYSLAEDSCTAFEMFIRRNSKINGLKTKSYLNFVQFTKRLLKAKNQPGQISKKKELKDHLTVLEPFIHRTWAEEKIDVI